VKYSPFSATPDLLINRSSFSAIILKAKSTDKSSKFHLLPHLFALTLSLLACTEIGHHVPDF
jgi:hypothetical protein